MPSEIGHNKDLSVLVTFREIDFGNELRAANRV